METVPCNLCGSTDHSFVYRRPDGVYFPDEWFDVVECNGCGLGFVNPRPNFDEMARFYKPDYYDGFVEEDHTERYRAESAYLPPVDPTTGPPKLLDIGCGIGDFARFAAGIGWQVEGVEPFCPVPIDDFPVYRQAFDTIQGLENRFDAVTAWAVLEHVHDPMAYFEKASAVLKPGGSFIFLVTNFRSLSSKRLFHEDAPRHLHFFTKQTVAAYLDKVGMNLVRADFSDEIFKMGSRGAVAYAVTRIFKRRPFEWRDLPLAYRDFLATQNRKPSLGAFLDYAARHPVALADRLAEPVMTHWQKLTNSYGIVTYVGKKSP